MKKIIVAAASLLVVFITGCNSDDAGSVGGSGSLSLIDCPADRPPPPVACTTDYNPVCGRQNDRTIQTYANSCNACADLKVIGYQIGTCP